MNPAAKVDNSVLGGLADPEEEVVEVISEPVAKQQAKAKALRLRSDPIPSSSAVVGAIENPSRSSGSRIVGSEASSSSNPVVNTSSGLSFLQVRHDNFGVWNLQSIQKWR